MEEEALGMAKRKKKQARIRVRVRVRDTPFGFLIGRGTYVERASV